RLAFARTYPGTQTPHGGASDWKVTVADNVADLQVAFGIDTADAVTPADGVLVETGDGTDEWLYNHPDDDDTEARWQGTGTHPSRMYYVRVNTVAITDRRDRTYSAPDPTRIEDHAYGATELLAAPDGRQYRRRNLQTVIDLRNLS
ncbi:MAG: PilW family protein, partial [Acidimicrobiia bacterium]|nr:PilW family protein [Acidimicrobiia bacterium]